MQRPGFVKAPNLSLTAVLHFCSYSENMQEVKQNLNRSGRVAVTCDVFQGKGNGLIHGSHSQWPSLCFPEYPLFPPEHPLLPLPQGCVPLQGGRDSISEPGVELSHLEQVSGADLSSSVAVRVSLLLEAVLFHPAPTSCWLCCSFMSPTQHQMGMLLVHVHKRSKSTLPFWARAADNISFWMMPALVSFNSFEVSGVC